MSYSKPKADTPTRTIVAGRSKEGAVFSERKTSAGTVRVVDSKSLAKAAKSAGEKLRPSTSGKIK